MEKKPFAAMVKLIKKKTVPLFAVRPINPIGHRLISNTRVSDKLKKAIGRVPHARKAKCTLRPTNAITRNTANALALMANEPFQRNMPAEFAVPIKSKASIYGVAITRNAVMKVHLNSSTAQQASDVAEQMQSVLTKTAIAVIRRTN